MTEGAVTCRSDRDPLPASGARGHAARAGAGNRVTTQSLKEG